MRYNHVVLLPVILCVEQDFLSFRSHIESWISSVLFETRIRETEVRSVQGENPLCGTGKHKQDEAYGKGF